jgi:hypothetical protein
MSDLVLVGLNVLVLTVVLWTGLFLLGGVL